MEPYLLWVQSRVVELKMSYYREEPLVDLFLATTQGSYHIEDLQFSLLRMQQENEAWKNKYHTLKMSHAVELKKV